ncbi:uncharacterized protein SAPINGB_P004963 [Magnusiomyces paraingens]|uniref:Uncharacterized protein n=1 Tax=Magnusiomyces paraingens TaxID=2606893 RepID=A0A5E8BXE9_9ASCO|nr:uncharacterized protein SAPINGB_P004963 [Saprochaete ingens]VVT56319.1 unnamed protein product [Saprochaete ingens]
MNTDYSPVPLGRSDSRRSFEDLNSMTDSLTLHSFSLHSDLSVSDPVGDTDSNDLQDLLPRNDQAFGNNIDQLTQPESPFFKNASLMFGLNSNFFPILERNTLVNYIIDLDNYMIDYDRIGFCFEPEIVPMTTWSGEDLINEIPRLSIFLSDFRNYFLDKNSHPNGQALLSSVASKAFLENDPDTRPLQWLVTPEEYLKFCNRIREFICLMESKQPLENLIGPVPDLTKINCCPNGHVAYWGPYANALSCPACGKAKDNGAMFFNGVILKLTKMLMDKDSAILLRTGPGASPDPEIIDDFVKGSSFERNFPKDINGDDDSINIFLTLSVQNDDNFQNNPYRYTIVTARILNLAPTERSLCENEIQVLNFPTPDPVDYKEPQDKYNKFEEGEKIPPESTDSSIFYSIINEYFENLRRYGFLAWDASKGEKVRVKVFLFAVFGNEPMVRRIFGCSQDTSKHCVCCDRDKVYSLVNNDSLVIAGSPSFYIPLTFEGQFPPINFYNNDWYSRDVLPRIIIRKSAIACHPYIAGPENIRLGFRTYFGFCTNSSLDFPLSFPFDSMDTFYKKLVCDLISISLSPHRDLDYENRDEFIFNQKQRKRLKDILTSQEVRLIVNRLSSFSTNDKETFNSPSSWEELVNGKYDNLTLCQYQALAYLFPMLSHQFFIHRIEDGTSPELLQLWDIFADFGCIIRLITAHSFKKYYLSQLDISISKLVFEFETILTHSGRDNIHLCTPVVHSLLHTVDYIRNLGPLYGFDSSKPKKQYQPNNKTYLTMDNNDVFTLVQADKDLKIAVLESVLPPIADRFITGGNEFHIWNYNHVTGNLPEANTSSFHEYNNKYEEQILTTLKEVAQKRNLTISWNEFSFEDHTAYNYVRFSIGQYVTVPEDIVRVCFPPESDNGNDFYFYAQFMKGISFTVWCIDTHGQSYKETIDLALIRQLRHDSETSTRIEFKSDLPYHRQLFSFFVKKGDESDIFCESMVVPLTNLANPVTTIKLPSASPLESRKFLSIPLPLGELFSSSANRVRTAYGLPQKAWIRPDKPCLYSKKGEFWYLIDLYVCGRCYFLDGIQEDVMTRPLDKDVNAELKKSVPAFMQCDGTKEKRYRAVHPHEF